jgi:hypothetical protein
VPSNFIEKLRGDDLLEFHRSAVLTMTNPVEEEEYSTTVPVNLPLDLQEMTPENEIAPICEKEK